MSVRQSVLYHDIFDYPLSSSEIKKWATGRKVKFHSTSKIENQKGFYFVKGKRLLTKERLKRERISKEKLKIAIKAGEVLKKIPFIKMVGITGSLAMMNANKESDIDLMIITSKNFLWTTRLITVCCLLFTGFKLRRPNNSEEEDRLCLNMWFDESDLVWKEENIFSAHEFAQIISVVNKDKTYEKLLFRNKWILEYWPNAVGISRKQLVDSRQEENILATSYLLLATFLETIAFKLQYLYMKRKITRETITKTRAVFHPRDLSKHVLTEIAPHA